MTIAIVVVFFVSHYMFASLTAHTTALLPVFIAAVAAVPDLPIKQVSLLLCYTLGLMGVLTPYATGAAPIYYASGYVSRKEFWRLGVDLRAHLSGDAPAPRRSLPPSASFALISARHHLTSDWRLATGFERGIGAPIGEVVSRPSRRTFGASD